jgi:hypothetical protein
MADFFDTLFLALDGNFRLRECDRGERNVDLVSSADVHAEWQADSLPNSEPFNTPLLSLC